MRGAEEETSEWEAESWWMCFLGLLSDWLFLLQEFSVSCRTLCWKHFLLLLLRTPPALSSRSNNCRSESGSELHQEAFNRTSGERRSSGFLRGQTESRAHFCSEKLSDTRRRDFYRNLFTFSSNYLQEPTHFFCNCRQKGCVSPSCTLWSAPSLQLQITIHLPIIGREGESERLLNAR